MRIESRAKYPMGVGAWNNRIDLIVGVDLGEGGGPLFQQTIHGAGQEESLSTIEVKLPQALCKRPRKDSPKTSPVVKVRVPRHRDIGNRPHADVTVYEDGKGVPSGLEEKRICTGCGVDLTINGLPSRIFHYSDDQSPTQAT